jgi:hypothetical protein
MIVVAYKHGMRASEVCNLRLDDVDFKGSERESDEVRILSGFLENDEFGLGGSQALRF